MRNRRCLTIRENVDVIQALVWRMLVIAKLNDFAKLKKMRGGFDLFEWAIMLISSYICSFEGEWEG